MEKLLSSEILKIITSLIVIAFKVLYSMAIYYKSEWPSDKKRNILTCLAVPFPIITGIICIIKYRKSAKDSAVIAAAFTIPLVLIIAVSTFNIYINGSKFYDRNGNRFFHSSDVTYTDIDGNTYNFNFDKAGYDYLYLNGTEERISADLCYLNADGYIVYDYDMSITAKDENSCVDADGVLYYPVKFSVLNKDGSIAYNFNSVNFKYDRLGNAYTYDYVPYYDIDGNKYLYSFNSDTMKGYYTNVSTNEAFENEYCFVDESGYLVYDKEQSFTEDETDGNTKTYSDLNGKKYYWASGVSWNENGDLLGSLGEVVEVNPEKE